MTHGYLLTGSGSNVYVQNLCRALVGQGHDVDLLCQEPDPAQMDFVASAHAANPDGIQTLWERETEYPGTCRLFRPEIGDLLPVYVYDDYPGWRVKTFLDLTDDEFEVYVSRNVGAMRSVLRARPADCMITNHSVPGPFIARRVVEETRIPYLSIVHGSCLQYLARRSEKYMAVASEGLDGAYRIVSPSPHGASTINEDFPLMKYKTLALSGGVDTGLFSPDALDESAVDSLSGGEGRGPEQVAALREVLSGGGDPLPALGSVAGSYHPRAHDRDAGARLRSLLGEDGPLVVYVGKLIHSKGVHSLISAFAGVRDEIPSAKLLIIGFGTLREVLEAITLAISEGDSDSLSRLVSLGRRLEGQTAGGLEHFEVGAGLSVRGLAESVEFVGPLDHGVLSRILPAADVAVVPSVFPEIFGLVAAEFAASGVVPFVSRHSGLAEAGAVVGAGLPFDITVAMDGFERNLAAAITDFLSLPKAERERCSRIVRENSVRDLSWDSLAGDLTGLIPVTAENRGKEG